MRTVKWMNEIRFVTGLLLYTSRLSFKWGIPHWGRVEMKVFISFLASFREAALLILAGAKIHRLVASLIQAFKFWVVFLFSTSLLLIVRVYARFLLHSTILRSILPLVGLLFLLVWNFSWSFLFHRVSVFSTCFVHFMLMSKMIPSTFIELLVVIFTLFNSIFLVTTFLLGKMHISVFLTWIFSPDIAIHFDAKAVSRSSLDSPA